MIFLLTMMKKSQVTQQYQASYHEEFGFDLQGDFSQVLEDAKHHVSESKLKGSSVHPEESWKTGSEKERRDKKSWKSPLVSWCKGDKKSKLRVNPTNNSQVKAFRKRQVYVSAPIYNCSNGPDVKHWGPKSGHLTSMFKSTKREESEIPYMSLHQQNSPKAVQSYGPLYLVT